MNDMPTAALDMGNRAAEDRDMDATIDTVRQEMNAGFKELSARIEDLRRESNARIDGLRAEMLENFKLIDAKIERTRTELMASIQGVQDRLDAQRRDHDRQFRWLVGLMLASLLGIAGMFAKAVHFY